MSTNQMLIFILFESAGVLFDGAFSLLVSVVNWLNLNRTSRPEVFCKKGVLRNFTKFTGKHLCQSLFFNKVAVLRPAALLKRDSGAGVFGATCSIFHPSKNNAASILQEILSVVPSAKIVAEI